MQLNRFIKDAGFKILAFSGLSAPQYAISLYLINCAASGMDEIATTHSEFSSLMGYDDKSLREALKSLSDKNMIRMIAGKTPDSIKISFEFDVHHWNIQETQKLSPREALVFPFMSQKDTQKKPKKTESSAPSSWEMILNEYTKGRDVDLIDIKTETKAAHVLADTHPVTQVSLMLKHFGTRIKSLSLLASSWQHYQELFESETQKVDFEDAKKKHLALDEKLRNYARESLSSAPEKDLSEEEIAVLKVIAYHQHPRRQLYWAYQLHERYPKLHSFFTDNADLMLSITTQGTIIKKTRPDKRDK